MDWNADGMMDIVSGDRTGFFNVFIRQNDSVLTAHYQYKLMDSTVLTVGANSQPAVVDWNGDGKKDLLLGNETGNILFYANQTSDSWPMFQSCETIQAAGVPILQYRANAYVFDLNLDGKQDLLVGANDGYVQYYRNTGTNANPVLAAPETLMTIGGVPIQPALPNYYGSRCGFGDWNNDGWPDFLISGYEGLVELYLGQPFVGVEQSAKPLPVERFSVQPVPGRAPVRISLVLARGTQAEVQVCDATGRLVRNLGTATGAADLVWNGCDERGLAAQSGVYFARLTTAGQAQSRMIVLTR